MDILKGWRARRARSADPATILEIAAIIAVKLRVIFTLWFLFFSPSHRTEVTPQTMSKALLGAAPQAAQRIEAPTQGSPQ